MSKSISLFSALLCTFIWGTTFIAQDTGMDNIGPFTFNAVRFFVGFLAILPLVLLFEIKKFKSELKLDKKTFIVYSFLIGLSLFLGSALQQVALLYTDVALGAIQTFIVAFFSFLIGILYEEFVYHNILMEIYSILYAGILSGGFAFVLQIYAQKNITPAPAAIIFSLEGVFATIAAWFILNQILDINNLLGCLFILSGVLLSQLLPLIKKE